MSGKGGPKGGPKRLPYVEEMFTGLIGLEVVDVFAQESDGYGKMRPDVGILLRDRTTKNLTIVWASQDQEGNGPGWFEVQSAGREVDTGKGEREEEKGGGG